MLTSSGMRARGTPYPQRQCSWTGLPQRIATKVLCSPRHVSAPASRPCEDKDRKHRRRRLVPQVQHQLVLAKHGRSHKRLEEHDLEAGVYKARVHDLRAEQNARPPKLPLNVREEMRGGSGGVC